VVIEAAGRRRRFRRRAARIASSVAEADVRYSPDSGLGLDLAE
jgi:hypothetical protein